MNKVEIEGIVEEIWEDKKNMKVRVVTGEGVGQNGPWTEYAVAQFYGRSKEQVQGVVKGQRVRIYGKATAFEYNGKWYSSLQGDRLVVAAGGKSEQHREERAPGADDDVGF
jgi:hypothetical protein